MLIQLMTLQQIVHQPNLLRGWCYASGERAFTVHTTDRIAGIREILSFIDSRRNINTVYGLDFSLIEDTVSYGYRARQWYISPIVY